MTDHFDEETQFWDRPEWASPGAVPRVSARDRTGSFERTRSHRIVRDEQPLPTRDTSTATLAELARDDDAAWADIDNWVAPLEDRRGAGYVGIDPKLVRIGAVALVGVLMIPVALALRDDSGDGMRSQTVAEVASTVVPDLPQDVATTVITVPATVAVPASAPRATSGSVSGAGASAAAAFAAPAEPVCAGTYTVIANDYWNRFPRSSGASVQEWLAANDATAATPLYVGDELCIPPGAKAPAAPPPTTTQAPATTAAPTTQAPTTAAPVTAPPTVAAPIVTAPPATAPRATSPPAAAPRAAGPTDPASVEAIIREVWPDDIEERALTIAKRESGLNPNVHNYCCYGVFAIYFEMGRNFLPQLGITSAEQLFDARTNIQAAYHLYTIAGWKPWVQTDPG